MKYLLLLFFVMITFCTSEENLNLQENSKYRGDYVGTFTGNLSGNIIFNVSSTGNLEGSIIYDTSNSSESLSGYVVISGKFDASTKTGLNFSGYLNDSSTNGKWTKGGNTRFYFM